MEFAALTHSAGGRKMDLRYLLIQSLRYVVFPAWVAAGFVDYWCHRRTAIALTSGSKESLLHVLQFFQIAVAIALALTFRIDSAVLVTLFVLVLAHAATGAWDVSYTSSRRYIAPLEQHAHSYMETAPFIAFAIVMLLTWNDVGFFGGEPRALGESWRLREDGIGLSAIVEVVGGLSVAALAIGEELWRTLKVGRV
jgi:hypothetical protein